MSESIVSLDHIQAKARAAHAAGRARDEHGFNWHAPALHHWQAEWDRCDVEQLETDERLHLRPVQHAAACAGIASAASCGCQRSASACS